MSLVFHNINAITNLITSDDLSREVYGLLGIPIDVINLADALDRIKLAAASVGPFFLSTANLNFLITSQSDADFRSSLLLSDLCTADGMPIVWIARVLSIPIKERTAGSDMFEQLKSAPVSSHRLKVFLFGGAENVAAAACSELNAQAGAVACAGSFYPGYCTVDEMSTDAIFELINSSDADFLIAAVGAKKGQAWLLRNRDRLRIPVRANLGAVINFQAGRVKRAPAGLQTWGLEWLWRIKEEPQLWRRYWGDGVALLKLLLTHVLPLVALNRWHRNEFRPGTAPLKIVSAEDHKCVTLNINGVATAETVEIARPSFRAALAGVRDVVINCAEMRLVDARFIGLLLMLNKQLKGQNLSLTFTAVPRRIERLFRLNGFGYLLRS